MTKRKLKEGGKNKSRLLRKNTINQLEVDFEKVLKGKKPKKNRKDQVEKIRELTEQDILDEVDLEQSKVTGRGGI